MSKEKQNVLILAIKYVSTLTIVMAQHMYIHSSKKYSELNIKYWQCFSCYMHVNPTIKYNSSGEHKKMAPHFYAPSQHALQDNFPKKLILTLHFFTPRVFLFSKLINKRL